MRCQIVSGLLNLSLNNFLSYNGNSRTVERLTSIVPCSIIPEHETSHLQQAAGVLTELKDHVLSWVPQEPTLDMAPDTLQSIIALLLAQAQDAIYLKVCCVGQLIFGFHDYGNLVLVL